MHSVGTIIYDQLTSSSFFFCLFRLEFIHHCESESLTVKLEPHTSVRESPHSRPITFIQLFEYFIEFRKSYESLKYFHLHEIT